MAEQTLTTATNREIRFSKRVLSISESPTLSVLNRATALKAKGVDIVDFGPGEPDFRTPDNISEAAKRAIDQGQTKYTHGNGTKVLRDAIAARYNRRYNTKLTADHIITGSGGKQELFNVMLSLVSDGDEVIIPSPYWVSFPDQVAFAGGKPVFAQCEQSNRYRPTFEVIERAASKKTRGVIVNSPCNPTGAVVEEGELRKIVDWCVARDIFLIFDETYELFVYDGIKHSSAMAWFEEYPENIIVVNSMSKTYAMTGWRLGYAVAHPEIISALGKIQSHSTSNPNSIAQAAALEALAGDQSSVRKMFEAYSERRAFLVPALNAIDGFCCADPDGSFYVFPQVSDCYGKAGIHDSNSFATFLLDEARVAVVPGIAFGGDDCVRISYATSMDRIQEGVRRLAEAVKKLR